MDEHVHAALASGDISIEEIERGHAPLRGLLRLAAASQLEMSVRTQWQRIHADRGEEAPPFPMRGVDDLGRRTTPTASPRRRCFEEINLMVRRRRTRPTSTPASSTTSSATSGSGPASVAASAGCHDPVRGVSDAAGPIWSHVTSALGSGDITYEEMQEVIAQFAAYSGSAVGEVLRGVADQWKSTQG